MRATVLSDPLAVHVTAWVRSHHPVQRIRLAFWCRREKKWLNSRIGWTIANFRCIKQLKQGNRRWTTVRFGNYCQISTRCCNRRSVHSIHELSQKNCTPSAHQNRQRAGNQQVRKMNFFSVVLPTYLVCRHAQLRQSKDAERQGPSLYSQQSYEIRPGGLEGPNP